MTPVAQFPFVNIDPAKRDASILPYIPIALQFGAQTVETLGLLDTGATVNVLPHEIGLGLGLSWEQQTTPVQLTGNLGQAPARVVLLAGIVAPFPAVRLAFAWTQVPAMPLIFGQTNFFAEFDVCFYRSRAIVELRQRQ